jgi:signal transduction histidine kinase
VFRESTDAGHDELPLAPEPRTPPPGVPAERDLLASVCHDLKAPLASMTMGVAFLRRVLPRNDDPTSRVVDALHRSTHRMSRTIASFSDLAKLQMGDLELDLRPAVVGDVMQSAFDLFLPEARADKLPLELDVDAPTSSFHLHCDQARLVQILWQLFVCASHVIATTDGVTLRARRDAAGDAVRFEVEARAPPARTTPAEMPKPELTIARGLVALHGGRLVVVRGEGCLTLSFAVPSTPPERNGEKKNDVDPGA